LLRSDITFGDGDEHAILTLKRSKTDLLHHGVEIILAATGTTLCPVTALRRLFAEDLQPLCAPLFRFATSAFTYERLVLELRERLAARGVKHTASFTGHSFRRGAAQTASDKGRLDSDIQKLGRWSSEAFRLYFTISKPQRYGLSLRFFTGCSPLLA